MPPKEKLVDYWDACVWLAYLNGEDEHSEIVEQCLAEVQRDASRAIVTSAFTTLEVAFIKEEQLTGKVNPAVERAISDLLHQECVINVPVSPYLIDSARRLVRLAVSRGKTLNPGDAIHLATATWMKEGPYQMQRVLTYDKRLMQCRDLIGLDICVPTVDQPQMSLDFAG